MQRSFEPQLRLNIYTADPDTPPADGLKLLSTWAATTGDEPAVHRGPNPTHDEENMKKRSLGTSGLDVSALGLGCMNMAGPYGPPQDPQEMISATWPPARPPTRAQIALAWLLAQKPWIVPIPGPTKLHRSEENLRGIDVEFTADELNDMTSAASKLQPVGDRQPEAMLNLTGQ